MSATLRQLADATDSHTTYIGHLAAGRRMPSLPWFANAVYELGLNPEQTIQVLEAIRERGTGGVADFVNRIRATAAPVSDGGVRVPPIPLSGDSR